MTEWMSAEQAVRETPNPYLEFFRELQAQGNPDRLSAWGYVRGPALERWGHAIPDERAIARLLQEPLIFEMGAGSGYWGDLIYAAADKMSGLVCSIASFDLYPQPSSGGNHVVQADANTTALEAAELGAALMTIWPSYKMSWAADALRLYHQAGGHRMIYVGEPWVNGWGGCTADEDFHRQLREDGVEVDIGDDGCIPQWGSMDDRLFIYDRA